MLNVDNFVSLHYNNIIPASALSVASNSPLVRICKLLVNCSKHKRCRNQEKAGAVDIGSVSSVIGVSTVSQCPEKDNFLPSCDTTKQAYVVDPKLLDITSPETPGMKPHVPRFKRIQEEIQRFRADNDDPLQNSSKRAKFLNDDPAVNMKDAEACDDISKFDWLHPTRIQDANRRRPEDPLYDKNTLYIPPVALSKMSASQKQYWSVKCKYMDVVLFFKVVS